MTLPPDPFAGTGVNPVGEAEAAMRRQLGDKRYEISIAQADLAIGANRRYVEAKARWWDALGLLAASLLVGRRRAAEEMLHTIRDR